MHIKSRFCLSSPFIIFRLFGIEVFFPFPAPLFLLVELNCSHSISFFVTVILNLSFKCCFLPLFYLVPCAYYFFICCPYSVSGLSYFKNKSVNFNISVNFFPAFSGYLPVHILIDNLRVDQLFPLRELGPGLWQRRSTPQ